MQDVEIKCRGVDLKNDCPDNATFIFTAKEQEYYADRGFEKPKRCKACREEKKARSEGGMVAPTYYKKDVSRKQNKKWQNQRDNGGYDGDE